ncbi:hypothetical protein [Sphingopyxis panaciterrae]
MLQGFSSGGEYGGAATFMAEYAPDERLACLVGLAALRFMPETAGRSLRENPFAPRSPASPRTEQAHP